MKTALSKLHVSPTSLKESEAIKTCDILTSYAETCGCVYCFLNPVFSSIVIVMETKSGTSKFHVTIRNIEFEGWVYLL